MIKNKNKDISYTNLHYVCEAKNLDIKHNERDVGRGDKSPHKLLLSAHTA